MKRHDSCFCFVGQVSITTGSMGLWKYGLWSHGYLSSDVEYIIVLKASLKTNSAWPAAEKFGE